MWRQLSCSSSSWIRPVLKVMVLCELLVLQVRRVELLPISQPPVHNLDLRIVDFNDGKTTDKDVPDYLGDGDLILEFRSENISGIVRLNRIEEGDTESMHQNKRQRHGKGSTEVPYDERGAMYFAVSVVSLYGLSIGVMVAFSLRKDWDEDEVKNFQRSWVRLDHQMEKQEKQRAKKMMTRAIIAIHQPKRSSVCAQGVRDTVYMALAPMALAAIPPATTAGADRRPSRESIIWNNLPPPMITIEEGLGAAATTDSDMPTNSEHCKNAASESVDGVCPGQSGYLAEDNNNDCADEEEEVDIVIDDDDDDDDVDDIDDDMGGEDDHECDIEEDGICRVDGQCPRDCEVDEDDGQLLEEYLLEGQLEDDLDLGSESLSPVEYAEPGIVPCSGNSVLPVLANQRGASRGHDSPPSLATPEEDFDLDDEVFFEPATPPTVVDVNNGEVTAAQVHLGVPSPVLPYMDDEDSSLEPV